MFNRIKFKSINNLLLFWFVIVSLLPLIVMTGLTYDQRMRSIREEAFNKLSGVREMQKSTVNTWLDHLAQHSSFLSKELGASLPMESTRSLYPSEKSAVSGILADMVSRSEYLQDLYFSRPEGVFLSSDPEVTSLPAELVSYGTRDLKKGNSLFSKVFRNRNNRLVMAIFHPLYSKSENYYGTLTGIIDLESTIFSDLLKRPGLGNSGEILIVKKDGTILNPLLWKDDAPLKLKVNTPSVMEAARGTTGNVREEDYRGEEVLASYTFLPRTNWGLVVKQDLVEVYTPIFSMLHLILIIFSFSVSGSCALAILISRNISRPIGKITDVAKRIDNGELTARNDVDRSDELGSLGRSINTMADSLLSLIRIQDGITGIVSTAVTHEGTVQFADILIRKLVEVTESGMGAFYLETADGKSFRNIASTGMNPDARNKAINAEEIEFQFGSSFMRKNIAFIKEIPGGSVFRFKTAAGVVPPREIISIPILLDRKVKAIIALASVWPYSQEHKNIVNLSWSSINTSFSNIINHEKTNLLANELSHKNTELRSQSEKLRTQSNEMRSQSEELLEQNIELEYQRKQVEEANRLKSEFLSNMSHELRTPLNSILALSRVMKSQTIEKITSEEAKYLEIIERNGRQLLNLINDILDLSKIESGKVEVSPELFSLRECIEEISESMIPMVAEKGVDLKLNISDEIPDIESDEEKVNKILFNIIGNAVKFTNTGKVSITAFLEEGNVYIEVEDTGVGIPANELPFIFDEFRQADGTSSRQFEGTGLGLAISKKTADMLGGRIFAESREGMGSKFSVVLPVKWSGQGKIVSRLRFNPRKMRKANPNKGKKILVIDDDFKARSIISEYLSREGYEVVHADNGEKALKMAYLYQPFAITLDLIMPDMDGWEVLQHLKEDPRTKDIPVVIISVSDEKETGIALGAVNFLTKPVEEKELLREIERIGDHTPRKIMVVDDSEPERNQMASCLLREGFNTFALSSGKECLKMLEHNKPDIVVLDLLMPDMDGFETLNQIRSKPSTAQIPVIIVTAKDLTEKEKELLSGNVISILEKSQESPYALGRKLTSIIHSIETKSGKDNAGKVASRNLLLVEDNEIAAMQVKMVLEKEGYTVDTVKGGKEALSFMEEHIPDGVILDLMMPGIDGFHVLHEIRKHPETHDVPVLVLTAKDLNSEDFERLSTDNIQQLIHKGDLDREGLVEMARMVFDGTPWTETGSGSTAETERKGPGNTAGNANKVKSSEPAVLIVEDNPDNMFTLKTLMGSGTYKFYEAADGEEGLRMALNRVPDLILLDISLPKMDGYEVVKRIKENSSTRKIPVIAVTARAMKGERERALASGCDDYISKPIDQDILEEKVSFWMGQ